VNVERVAVRYSKWGGVDHWHFELEPLGQDRFGWWFFGRKGLTQPAGRRRRLGRLAGRAGSLRWQGQREDGCP